MALNCMLLAKMLAMGAAGALSNATCDNYVATKADKTCLLFRRKSHGRSRALTDKVKNCEREWLVENENWPIIGNS